MMYDALAVWPMPAISMRKPGFRSRRRLSTPGIPSARISGRIGVAHEIDNSPGACSRAVFKIRKRRRSRAAHTNNHAGQSRPVPFREGSWDDPGQAYGLHSYVFWEQKRAQVGLYSMNGKKGFSGCPRIGIDIRAGRAPLRGGRRQGGTLETPDCRLAFFLGKLAGAPAAAFAMIQKGGPRPPELD